MSSSLGNPAATSEPALKKLKGAVTTPFQKKHLREFGLSISARSPDGAVIAVRCRFCLVLGRENPKIKTSWTFQGPPFRPQKYRQHISSQHAKQFEQYALMKSEQEQEEFFAKPTKAFETIPFHMSGDNTQLEFRIDQSIIDIIIAKMLWNPDDVGGQSHANALSLFKVDTTSSIYTVTVRKVKIFQLSIRFVGRGMSFRMASDAIQDAKEITDCAQLVGCNDYIVANNVRIACAVSFQRIAEAIQNQWAFSLAIDGSCCGSTSYIDVRVRFCENGSMQNLHLIAVPFNGSHTGVAMFEMLVRLFDCLCCSWKEKLISCSTDGAANMTGRVSGVVTRLSEVALPGFIRIWCVLHQIDLVMQDLYKGIDSGAFYKTLTNLIGHLRRQKLLIDRMRCTCPALSGTRWISMARVTSFFVENRSVLCEHLDTVDIPALAPSSDWWILLVIVNMISTDVSDVVQRLQGKQALLSQQSQEVSQLLEKWRRMTFVSSVNDAANSLSSEHDNIIVMESFRFEKGELLGLMYDQGLYVVQSLRQMDQNNADNIVLSVASMFVKLFIGLEAISAERDRTNGPMATGCFPCLPAEFLELRGRDFANLVDRYFQRLSLNWTRQRIDLLGFQHAGFRDLCDKNPRVRLTISRSALDLTFDEAWAVSELKTRFPELCEFAGGLASIFPNTASVESDFSSLKWEKDDFRSLLTDFALEGILHCKQYLHLLK